MNKAELINAAALKADVSKKDAEAVITAALDAITEALAEGEKVQLVGFGSFEVKKRAARLGRNPKTKEEIEIPASVVPTFKAGKALKDAVARYYRLKGGRCPPFRFPLTSDIGHWWTPPKAAEPGNFRQAHVLPKIIMIVLPPVRQNQRGPPL